MCDAEPNIDELRKQSTCAGLRECSRYRAFRSVGAVMNKILWAKITPAFAKEIAIMQIPQIRIGVAASSAQGAGVERFSISAPFSKTGKNFQQHAQAHVEHDASKIVEAALVVEHDDGCATWAKDTPYFVDRL